MSYQPRGKRMATQRHYFQGKLEWAQIFGSNMKIYTNFMYKEKVRDN